MLAPRPTLLLSQPGFGPSMAEFVSPLVVRKNVYGKKIVSDKRFSRRSIVNRCALDSRDMFFMLCMTLSLLKL